MGVNGCENVFVKALRGRQGLIFCVLPEKDNRIVIRG